MATNRLTAAPDLALGSFLRSRRERLQPAAFGLPQGRRRTPGLRREEVAERAHVSATWYTWLEQGRGGSPSADVLGRLARALALDAEETEHLFLLAGEFKPARLPAKQVSAQLQRVLDAFDIPAVVKTPDWTVVAWNRAAAAVLGDYGALPEGDRNVLRRLFSPGAKARVANWEAVARLIVASVRRDLFRAGQAAQSAELVEELAAQSAEFRAFWAEQDVLAHGEGQKRLIHPSAGPIELEFSTFAVDDRPDLAMVVFNPSSASDAQAVQSLIEAMR